MQPVVPVGLDHHVTEETTQYTRQEPGTAPRPWREKYRQPDEAADGIRLKSPAKAEVLAAVDAALLVVGRREHRPGPAPHPGPVAQTASRHGRCPVAVVPHD